MTKPSADKRFRSSLEDSWSKIKRYLKNVLQVNGFEMFTTYQRGIYKLI